MAMCCTASTTAWSISATEGAVPVALAGGDGLVLMAQASPPPTATKKTKKKGEKKKKKKKRKRKGKALGGENEGATTQITRKEEEEGRERLRECESVFERGEGSVAVCVGLCELCVACLLLVVESATENNNIFFFKARFNGPKLPHILASSVLFYLCTATVWCDGKDW